MAAETEYTSPNDLREGVGQQLFASPRSLVNCTVAGFIMFMLFHVRGLEAVLDRLVLLDNDDVMRLLQVRALLDGQDWFDTRQYRILPPEGLSMHWSRYLDLVLAGIVKISSIFVDRGTAERLMVAFWPPLLFAGYLSLVAVVARSFFGLRAACFSVLFAGASSPLLVTYFAPGRIDHHNVQVLLTVALLGAIAGSSAPVRRGMAGGLVVALSLAIGLETLPVIAAAGAVLAFRYLTRAEGADIQLASFGTSVPLAGMLLVAGQTPPSDWLVPTCDTLSAPWIGTLSVAGVAAVLLAAVPRLLGVSESVSARGVGLVLAGGATAAAALMLLGDCLAGPYGNLPEVARSVIGNHINEARSLLKTLSVTGSIMLMPLVPIALAVIGLVLVSWNRDERGGKTVLLVFILAGSAIGLLQVRSLVFPLAIIPVAAGLVVSRAAELSRPPPTRLALVVVVVLGLLPHTWLLLHRMVSVETSPDRMQDFACREMEAVEPLDGLEQGRVLSTLNLSSRILLFTGHDVLAGPYHRSADVFLNGYQPFVGTEDDMRQTVERFGADVVVVCRGETYGSPESFGTRLATGSAPAWLERVDLEADQLVVWRVRAPPGSAGS